MAHGRTAPGDRGAAARATAIGSLQHQLQGARRHVHGCLFQAYETLARRGVLRPWFHLQVVGAEHRVQPRNAREFHLGTHDPEAAAGLRKRSARLHQLDLNVDTAQVAVERDALDLPHGDTVEA